MNEKKIYIGVVGQIAGGKGELVKYLTDHLGFSSFSLSKILHDELDKKGIKDFTRKTLQDLGDKLRKQYGNDILAKKAIRQIQYNSRAAASKSFTIIESIRNPAEIEYLKKIPHFILIGVKAKRELRYKRLLERSKPWDPKTWQDFVIVDRRDLGVGQVKSGQQVGKCLAYCDYILTNNKDVEDFHRKVEKLIKKIISLYRLLI